MASSTISDTPTIGLLVYPIYHTVLSLSLSLSLTIEIIEDVPPACPALWAAIIRSEVMVVERAAALSWIHGTRKELEMKIEIWSLLLLVLAAMAPSHVLSCVCPEGAYNISKSDAIRQDFFTRCGLS